MLEQSAVFRASHESGFGPSCDWPCWSGARSFARAVSQGATRDIDHSSTRDSPGTADIESTARAEIILSRRCRSLEEIGVRIVLFSVAAGTVGGPALIATVAR